jgi:hypothetical protein
VRVHARCGTAAYAIGRVVTAGLLRDWCSSTSASSIACNVNDCVSAHTTLLESCHKLVLDMHHTNSLLVMTVTACGVYIDCTGDIAV